MTTTVDQNFNRPKYQSDLIASMREEALGPRRGSVRAAARVERIPDAVIDEMMAAIHAPPPETPGAVIVADGSGVRLVEFLAEPPAPLANSFRTTPAADRRLRCRARPVTYPLRLAVAFGQHERSRTCWATLSVGPGAMLWTLVARQVSGLLGGEP